MDDNESKVLLISNDTDSMVKQYLAELVKAKDKFTIIEEPKSINFEFKNYPRYGLFEPESFPKKDPLNGIDIEKEWLLIKNKTSKLPARLRNLITERKKINE